MRCIHHAAVFKASLGLPDLQGDLGCSRYIETQRNQRDRQPQHYNSAKYLLKILPKCGNYRKQKQISAIRCMTLIFFHLVIYFFRSVKNLSPDLKRRSSHFRRGERRERRDS